MEEEGNGLKDEEEEEDVAEDEERSRGRILSYMRGRSRLETSVRRAVWSEDERVE